MIIIKINEMDIFKEELDIFQDPPYQRQVIRGFVETIPAVSKTTFETVCQFVIPAENSYYIDTSHIFYKIKGKIMKKDANNLTINLADTDKVAPVNNFAQALFDNVTIEMNGTSIQSAALKYAYRTIFETLLNYGEDAKSSVLKCQFYFKDDPKCLDSILNEDTIANGTVTQRANRGHIQRRNVVKGSKVFEMIAPLSTDLFHQARYIPSKCSLKIDFTLNKPEFYLMADASVSHPFMNIEKMELYVRRLTLNSDVIVGLDAGFSLGNAKFPLKRVEVIRRPISTGTTGETIANLAIGGKVPSRIVIGMVDNDAATGSYIKNPFNFKHYNISMVKVTVNNDTVFKTINLNIANGEFLDAYHSLFTQIDRPMFMSGNYITPEDWANGYGLFAFDLSPDLMSANYNNGVIKGTTSLELSFKEATPNPIDLIAYLEFEDQLEITSDRKILYTVARDNEQK